MIKDLGILHITEDHTSANSGITASLSQLVAFLKRAGVSTDVLTVGGDDDLNSEPHLIAGPVSMRRWRYAPAFQHALLQKDTATVFHVHGVWTHPQWAAARFAFAKGTPFVLSPHNMFDRWLWNQNPLGRIKKSLYWRLVARSAFRKATVIHALSVIERDTLRADFFPGCRIEVLPNAVSLEAIDHELAQIQEPPRRDYLLFLGRIHPVKGLEQLLEAFKGLSSPRDTELLIAGSGLEEPYGQSLARRVAGDRALRDRVHFAGPVEGARKWSLLSRARAVCIPSFTEGMSLTTLEALATGAPVVTTPDAGPPEVAQYGGIVCGNGAEPLRRALEEVLHWSDAEIGDRRLASRRLAEERFDWEVVGPKYLDLYRSLSA